MRTWGILTLVVMAFCLGLWARGERVEVVERVEHDTIRVTDIRVDTVFRDKVIYRRLPSVEVVRTDTLVLTDTVFVAIPIETYIAQDTSYYIEATGYDVRFRHIEFYPTTIYNTERVSVPRRWGIGIQAGYGASKQGISPYIGIGVQYNIFSF